MNNYGYPQQQYGAAINRPIYSPLQTTPMVNQNSTPRIRPVASLDEVRAISIDFDGSVFYFPDYANRKIYTKQINMDGTASINMYELKEIPTSSNTNVDYITRDEFNTALTAIKDAFAQMAQAATAERETEKPQFNF